MRYPSESRFLPRCNPASYCAAALLLLSAPLASHGFAQTFDLRDVDGDTQDEVDDDTADAKPSVLELYLHANGFRNPVGRYMSAEDWDEQLPIVNKDGTLAVASSLIDATRHEGDARALSSVLAAYRDGADKKLITEPASSPIILGVGTVRDDESSRSHRRSTAQTQPDSTLPQPLPPPLDQEDEEEQEKREEPQKATAPESNPRLGARIVVNLSTFRSCSGALIEYLDHLSQKDAKTQTWARMIRRSLGIAALPPDNSCL